MSTFVSRAWDKYGIIVRARNDSMPCRTGHSFGWPPNRIKVLDGDLGRSGASTTDRTDFKTLVADVSLGNAGAVLALEASRLARSNADWHRLIEICGITRTLLIDEDGCYDPSDFNDGLVVGAQGNDGTGRTAFHPQSTTRRKAEQSPEGRVAFPLAGWLRVRRSESDRERSGRTSSSARSNWSSPRFSKPVPPMVLFSVLPGTNLLFPKRSYGGVWAGKLQWGRLTDSRVLGILKNPSYAGVYAFGRYRCVKDILEDGEVRSRIACMPRDEWLVEIRDHHEGYTSFEQHLKNLDTIERNRTNPKEAILSGPAREGLAMLQGLLICGCCGRRLTPRYRGNGGLYPIYECNWRKREGLSKTSCMSVQCGYLDRAIEQRVWQVVNEEHLNLALDAYDILQQREQQISTQWKLRLQRAEYEVQLAQKRYEQVDPENRLVASTLEQRWNDALIELEDVQNQIAELQQKEQRDHFQQREEVLKLAQDLPRLWKSKATSTKDKKRILQLLIQDITVEKPERGKVILHLRWQGGQCEDLDVELPRPAAERWRHSDALVQRVRELAQNYSDDEIAAQLNAEGLKSNKGNAFTRSSVSWIRHKHAIPPVDKKKPGEQTVQEVSQQFGVSPGVVYYWIANKIIHGPPPEQWFTLLDHDQSTEKARTRKVGA